MDYWCVLGNPTAPKRAGWAKIALMQAAMYSGADVIIWLDADAVVVRTDFNLANAIQCGIGMVRHPNPDHWNTGVIVAVRSPQVLDFFATVERSPENDSAWMEQEVVNELAAIPSYASLITALDAQLNSTPGAVMASNPVVLAAHGLPMDERRKLLKHWLTSCQKTIY
jgi:hypothetical protein